MAAAARSLARPGAAAAVAELVLAAAERRPLPGRGADRGDLAGSGRVSRTGGQPAGGGAGRATARRGPRLRPPSRTGRALLPSRAAGPAAAPSDEPLAGHTTMRVGGPADLLVAATGRRRPRRPLVRFARAARHAAPRPRPRQRLVVSRRRRPRPGHPVAGRGLAHRGRPSHRGGGPAAGPGGDGRRSGPASPDWSSGWRSRARRRRGLGQRRRPRLGRGRRPGVGHGPAGGRRRGASEPAAALGLAYRDSRFKHAPAGGASMPGPADASASARRPTRPPIEGPARRDPPLAPGASAARPAQRRQRLPQPAGRLGRPPDRRLRPQGHAARRRRDQREARQLHRQRGRRDRLGRPPPGRAGQGGRRRTVRRRSRVRGPVRRRLVRLAQERRERPTRPSNGRRRAVAEPARGRRVARPAAAGPGATFRAQLTASVHGPLVPVSSWRPAWPPAHAVSLSLRRSMPALSRSTGPRSPARRSSDRSWVWTIRPTCSGSTRIERPSSWSGCRRSSRPACRSGCRRRSS